MRDEQQWKSNDFDQVTRTISSLIFSSNRKWTQNVQKCSSLSFFRSLLSRDDFCAECDAHNMFFDDDWRWLIHLCIDLKFDSLLSERSSSLKLITWAHTDAIEYPVQLHRWQKRWEEEIPDLKKENKSIRMDIFLVMTRSERGREQNLRLWTLISRRLDKQTHTLMSMIMLMINEWTGRQTDGQSNSRHSSTFSLAITMADFHSNRIIVHIQHHFKC